MPEYKINNHNHRVNGELISHICNSHLLKCHSRKEEPWIQTNNSSRISGANSKWINPNQISISKTAIDHCQHFTSPEKNGDEADLQKYANRPSCRNIWVLQVITINLNIIIIKMVNNITANDCNLWTTNSSSLNLQLTISQAIRNLAAKTSKLKMVTPHRRRRKYPWRRRIGTMDSLWKTMANLARYLCLTWYGQRKNWPELEKWEEQRRNQSSMHHHRKSMTRFNRCAEPISQAHLGRWIRWSLVCNHYKPESTHS